MKILLETLVSFLTKPFTKKYPVERAEVQPKFRGKICFLSKKCTGCRLCEGNCPSEAIKFFRKGKINFDMGRCIFCGVCVDTCPAAAIKMDKVFEYSTRDKKELVVR